MTLEFFTIHFATLFLLLLSMRQTQAWDIADWPDITVSSPFKVYAVDTVSGGCDVPSAKARAMKDAGFTKVACPFNSVLIGATDQYKDEYVLFGANVLANILDQDSDGKVDDPRVVASLSYKSTRGGAMLACGISEEEERREEQLEDVFDLTFSCQTWKGDYGSGESNKRREFKGIMMEEAFHMVHQNGYAVVYPEELGMSDFTSSVVGRETARLQCVKPGYFHPENVCPSDSPREPGNPASSPLRPGDGDCTYPDCDIAEFYKMALFLAIGMGEKNDPSGPMVWVSDYMPERKSEVLAMLSREFKDMIARPELHQLRSPITGEYRGSTGPVPAPTRAPVPAPTRAPVPAPTRAPVPTPTRAPVPAPTPTVGENPLDACFDRELSFRGQERKDCDWVGRRPRKRCGKTWNGKDLWEFCPVTCKMGCLDCCDISYGECLEKIEEPCDAVWTDCEAACEAENGDVDDCIDTRCEETFDNCHDTKESECSRAFESCERACD